MSQNYVATPGTIPGYYLTSITTDFSETIDTPDASTAVCVPSGGNIRATGDNGIATATDPLNPNWFLIRFQKGNATTNDDTPKPIFVFETISNQTITMQLLIAARCTAGAGANSSLGGYTTLTVKNVGGVLSIIDGYDFFKNIDPALDGCNITTGVSGVDIIVYGTGLVAHTINWGVCAPGIVASEV